MWMISSFKVTTGLYYKVLNFVFLYLTMICAISSVSYFGLDYTLTNPLGLVHEDRLMDQKGLLETAFINTKASDRNTRRNRGRHGRRERWKRRVRRYRTFDASLYDQGTYDLFPIEDLNYGFDRFWLRRKIRNHRVHFRFFPGPWMRSFKKQLSRPRLESFMGPRVEFFRILFEQVYHPEFHEFSKTKNVSLIPKGSKKEQKGNLAPFASNKYIKRNTSVYTDIRPKTQKQGLMLEHSALRKFIRKVNSRVKSSTITLQLNNGDKSTPLFSNSVQPIYSKRWKQLFSKLSHQTTDSNLRQQENLFRRFYSEVLLNKNFNPLKQNEELKKRDSLIKLSKKDRQILRYKTFLTSNEMNPTNIGKEMVGKVENFIPKVETLNLQQSTTQPVFIDENQNLKSQTTSIQNNAFLLKPTKESYKPLTLLHPLKFYLQRNQAFERKLKFYGANVYRTFGVENNAPYFRTMMRRFFYYYKPTLRWERTMRTATMRKARRKGPRIVRKLNVDKKTETLSKISLDTGIKPYSNMPVNQELNQTSIVNLSSDKKLLNTASTIKEDGTSLTQKAEPFILSTNERGFQKPTHFYSLVNKRATRYRYQIYKDVLQHWYYTPFNRLFLKFDIDSFIRRQPTSYFLTKKEEQLLHLRRLMLGEHYDTLRWYTSMQHYSSMKARIGGTKSFASRPYSQQFQGTFKKIRHLFALTPSSSDNTILKFDQPLYNEYSNKQNYSILNDSLIHEELLADDDIISSDNFYLASNFGDDLPNQSNKVIREYLLKAEPLRKEYINNLLAEKNYWELTQFLFKGQKIRGSNPITNERSFLNQEKNFLYTTNEKQEMVTNDKRNSDRLLSNPNSTLPSKKTSEQKQLTQETSTVWLQNLWIQLFQKCQNTLYDQEALKIYLSRHVDKRKKQRQRQEKYLSLRLDRLKNWLLTSQTEFPNNRLNKETFGETKQNLKFVSETNMRFTSITSAIQKGIKESILFQKNLTNYSVKSNTRNNRPEIVISPTDFDSTNNKTKQFQNFDKSFALLNTGQSGESQTLKGLAKQNELKNILINRIKVKQILRNEIEQDLRKTLKSFNKSLFDSNLRSKSKEITTKYSDGLQEKKRSSIKQKTKKLIYLINQSIIPFKTIFKFTLDSAILKPVRNVKNVLKPSFSLEPGSNSWKMFWRKQEMALAKRKKTRRTLKRLKNTNERQRTSETSLSTPYLLKMNKNSFGKRFPQSKIVGEGEKRQKRDINETTSSAQLWTNFEQKRRFKSWNRWYNNVSKFDDETFIQKVKNFSVLEKKFKRKRTRLRRNRPLKRRSPIKKRTLGEKLKRQFKLLKRYSRSSDNLVDTSTSGNRSAPSGDKKVEIFQMITKRKYMPLQSKESEFQTRETKQRRTRFIKRRFWRKHKKQKYAQDKRKQRKRRRHAAGKIRTMNKEYKRIKSGLKVKQWWWDHFLPNYKAMINATWETEAIEQKREKLLKLSSAEILQRDLQNVEKNLQIGDKDYKPLALPEAIRIRENLIKKGSLSVSNSAQTTMSNLIENQSSRTSSSSTNLEKLETKNQNFENFQQQNFSSKSAEDLDIIGQVTKNALLYNSLNEQDLSTPFAYSQDTRNKIQKISETIGKAGGNVKTKLMVDVNPIPFYAGWDESLRKFVVTNRFLSQKSADTQFSFLATSSMAPLRGMNAATTLYWQVPFTTYDPDQFFALGMDGFSPIGWRKFHFRHSKQTTKPILVQSQTFAQSFGPSSILSIWENSNKNTSNNLNKVFLNKEFQKSKFNIKNQLRRSQKRYKRVKKHPRPPVWFPSGPLTNQVLPVHYIYVFYKRSRLPRDRYIRRRLRMTTKNKDGAPASIRESFTTITDFTLRKRVKPRRKYHRKRHLYKTENLFIRRRSFRDLTSSSSYSGKEEGVNTTNANRERPISPNFKGKARSFRFGEGESITQEQQSGDIRKTKLKQRRKVSAKQQSENLRIRQLRRRVQRQVIRPVWRYRPKAGGYTWPGDYLRLELVKAPILNLEATTSSINTKNYLEKDQKISTKQRKTRKKKKRTIQEWQIQPKKYLLQKHNLKVLKKRLEKAQNSHKLYQRVKELSYLMDKNEV